MMPPESARALAWLPAEALGARRTAAAVAPVVDAWSARWIGGDGWRAAPDLVALGGDDWTVLRQGSAVDITARPKAMQALGFAMLAMRPRDDLTAADRTLLRRIAMAAVDDLHAAIEALAPPTAGAGPRRRLTIGPKGGGSLAIDIAGEALVAIARRTFAPLSRAMPLAARGTATAGQRVACAAHLGTVTLSVDQVEALEPGDIVLLDQSLADIVPLAIAGRRSDLRVALHDDRPAPRMQD